jgi:ATP-binding cassette subfamily F protein 3
MDALTHEKAALDAFLASEAAYAGDARESLKDRIARQGEVTWQLARLETEWLEIAEALEKAGTTDAT